MWHEICDIYSENEDKEEVEIQSQKANISKGFLKLIKGISRWFYGSK